MLALLARRAGCAVAARVGQAVAVGGAATALGADGADDADQAALLKATHADRVGVDLRGGDAVATRLGLAHGDKNRQEGSGGAGLSDLGHLNLLCVRGLWPVD